MSSSPPRPDTDACDPPESGIVIIDLEYPLSPLLGPTAVFPPSEAHIEDAPIETDHNELEANSTLATQGSSIFSPFLI